MLDKPYPDSKGDTGLEPDRGSPTGPARWVKMLGIIIAVVLAVVLLLLIVVLLLTGTLGPS